MSFRKYKAKREDVKKVFSSPLGRVQTDFFLFLYKKDQKHKNPVFSCIVPKKIAKKAIQRNVIKRRCREIVYPYFQKIPDRIIGVITVKRSILPLSPKDLQKEIDLLFQKINQQLKNP